MKNSKFSEFLTNNKILYKLCKKNSYQTWVVLNFKFGYMCIYVITNNICFIMCNLSFILFNNSDEYLIFFFIKQRVVDGDYSLHSSIDLIRHLSSETQILLHKNVHRLITIILLKFRYSLY